MIDKLHSTTMQALRQPEIKARFAGMQFEAMDESSQAAEQRLTDQAKLFAEIARKVGIKPQ